MGYGVIWLPKAEQRFDEIIEYLEKHWTEKDIENFVVRTDEVIANISKYPRLYSRSVKKNIPSAIRHSENLKPERLKSLDDIVCHGGGAKGVSTCGTNPESIGAAALRNSLLIVFFDWGILAHSWLTLKALLSRKGYFACGSHILQDDVVQRRVIHRFIHTTDKSMSAI